MSQSIWCADLSILFSKYILFHKFNDLELKIITNYKMGEIICHRSSDYILLRSKVLNSECQSLYLLWVWPLVNMIKPVVLSGPFG